MNKLAHGLVTAAFATSCWLLWVIFLLIENAAVHLMGGTQLPAFARLCFNLRPLLWMLPAVAAVYCVFVWVRKSDGQKTWVGFFATTVYALILLAFPTMITCLILLIQMFYLLAKQ